MAHELTSALGLGEPYHLGIAVSDLGDAIERFQSILGVGPWGRIDAEVPSIYRGAETVSGVRSAFARLGSMLIEIVEPTTGDFPAKTFLKEKGEGIYHMGYWVEDIHTAIERAAALGIAVDWMFPAQSPQVVYLDAAQTLGIHVELVNPAMRPGIEAAIAKAST